MPVCVWGGGGWGGQNNIEVEVNRSKQHNEIEVEVNNLDKEMFED